MGFKQPLKDCKALVILPAHQSYQEWQ